MVNCGQLFHFMDLNRNNQVSFLEFEHGLKLAQIFPTHNQLIKLFNDLDIDGNGRITWDEVIRAVNMKKSIRGRNSAKRLPGLRENTSKRPEKNISDVFTWSDLEEARKKRPQKLRTERYKRALDEVTKILRNACKAKRLLYGSVMHCALDLFSAVDVDGSGQLDIDEFSQALKRLGLGLKNSDILHIFGLIDKDKSGYLDYDEFAYALKHKFHRHRVRRHSDIPSHIVDRETAARARGVMSWTPDGAYNKGKREDKGLDDTSAILNAVRIQLDGDNSEEQSIARTELENSLNDQSRSWRDGGMLGIGSVVEALKDSGVPLTDAQARNLMRALCPEAKKPEDALIAPKDVVIAIFEPSAHFVKKEGNPVEHTAENVEELKEQVDALTDLVKGMCVQKVGATIEDVNRWVSTIVKSRRSERFENQQTVPQSTRFRTPREEARTFSASKKNEKRTTAMTKRVERKRSNSFEETLRSDDRSALSDSVAKRRWSPVGFRGVKGTARSHGGDADMTMRRYIFRPDRFR
eukprot:g3049.t1